MAGHRKFSELRAKMPPEARARVEARVREAIADMPLHELRTARGLTQTTLAQTLHMKQPTIARVERQTNMYISTLRSIITAMGGSLDIIARFPDGAVHITNFDGEEETVEAKPTRKRRLQPA